MGAPKQRVLIASNAGYGFVTLLENLHTRNQKGKALITLPEGASPLDPLHVTGNPAERYAAAVTAEGRMLVFGLSELPELPKGKGNKIIHIAAKDFKAGTDRLKHLVVFPEGAALTIYAGRRHFRMVFGNLANFMGNR